MSYDRRHPSKTPDIFALFDFDSPPKKWVPFNLAELQYFTNPGWPKIEVIFLTKPPFGGRYKLTRLNDPCQ